jgi:threonine/homoserine/homoserine lactone efflux protein
MDGDLLLGFIGVGLVVIVTPGQDTALVVRNTLSGGRRAGFFTAFGIGAGQQGWTLIAAVGLTALLVASEPVFLAIRFVGAAYLVWLGAGSLWAAWQGADHPARLLGSGSRSAARSFRQGAFSNLSNPKMAVLFTSLMPPFLPAGMPPFAGFLLLGVIFSTMTVAWLSGYAAIVERARDRLRRGRLRRALDGITGGILVALGVRIVTEPA